MSYLKARLTPRCYMCGVPAMYEVMNDQNEVDNYACLPHGTQRVGQLQREAKELPVPGAATWVEPASNPLTARRAQ